MASRTPGRPAGTGYYADASSPIASTPQRSRATPGPSKLGAPPTPSIAALSPMRGAEHPKQRVEHEEEASKGWTGIFSPVLKFFGPDDASSDSGAVAATGGAGAYAAAAPVAAGRAAATLASPAAGSAYGYSAASIPSRHAGPDASAVPTLNAAPAARAAAVPASPAAVSRPAVATASAAASPAIVRTTVPVRAAPAPAPAPPPPPPPEDDDQEYEEFNPYLFIKMLPAYSSVAPAVPNVALPRKVKGSPPVSLVLDLDETLVHCSVEPIDDADVTFPVVFNDVHYEVYVRKRPHLDKFLNWIAGRFEVTIFTASQQVYAERLLNLLDPEGRVFNYRLYRDSCLNVEGNYLKDLNVLGRDLTKAVLVDNSPHAFGYQLDNGIPIESWFDDRHDTELLKLMRFLETIQNVPDVRPIVREKFRLWKLVQDAQLPHGHYYG